MEEFFKEKALEYHSRGNGAKNGIIPGREITSPQQLTLAYTPGVAAPAMEIDKDRWKAYRYTNKGNLVAVISNGSSVLGLGNIGALASKPIMESKAMLFKLYADIDAFDIEISENDPEKIVTSIQSIAPTFGGINLEDIKAPECFYIEERLRNLLDIPVLHDDQHGTAVVIAAALINSCKIAGRKLQDARIVICGAGSAGISTARLLLAMGVVKENIIMVDSKGVITTERNDVNGFKKEFARRMGFVSLSQAIKDADVFIGLSKGNLLGDKEILSMAPDPIIFALANPIPEVTYAHAKELRKDAIVATGRSDAPNQINNVLAFPYLFRGALDTLSVTINESMKIAAAQAIAGVAQQLTPESIEKSYGRKLAFGKEYIIPTPGDVRLVAEVSSAVAAAAMTSGVARNDIASFKEYASALLSRIEYENFFSKEILRHRNKGRHHMNFRERIL